MRPLAMHRGHKNRQPYTGVIIGKNVAIAVVTPTAIFVTLANGAVVWLIIRRRNLQRLRNMPLLSLALADLIVGLFIGSLSVAVHAMPGNVQICKARLILEAFCYTASLLNMFTASVERWIAIFRPLRYHRYINPKSIWKMIGAAWTLTLIITLLTTCFRCRVNRRSCMWKRLNKGVLPIIFCVLFLLLSFIMGLMQIRIYRVVRYHSRKIVPAVVMTGERRSPQVIISSENQHTVAAISNFRTSDVTSTRNFLSEPSLPQQDTRNGSQRILISSQIQNERLPVIGPDVFVEYQGQLRTIENGINIDLNARATTRVNMNGKRSGLTKKNEEQEKLTSNKNTHLLEATFISACNSEQDEDKLTVTANSSNTEQTTTTAPIERRKSTRSKRRRLQSFQQHSTASAVSMLYVVFMLMWTPYLIFTILCSLKIGGIIYIQGHYITRLLPLLNSLVNPLIYTIRIQEFRRALKDFICKRR